MPEQGLFAWEGKTASQVENSPKATATLGQYLPGGQIQIFIDFKFEANANALQGMSAKMGRQVDKVLERIPTPWTDTYNGLHIPPKEFVADFLGPLEIESKNGIKTSLIEKSGRSTSQDDE